MARPRSRGPRHATRTAVEAFHAALDAQPAGAVPVQRRLLRQEDEPDEPHAPRDRFGFGLDVILAGPAARS